MSKIIEVKNLRKSYKDKKAVNDISFYVEQGKLFSFLGPNGAGKSTTINILCTLLKYDSGTITIDGNTLGKDDDKIHQLLGVVYQESFLDELLTVKENLKLRGGFYIKDKKKLNEAIARVSSITGLDAFLNRPYGKLSGGQKRRADIARALIHQPKILVLDEPTTGLDPQTRKSVWEMIQSLQEETGMTIFLTTHYMEEAAKSDYIVVIDSGEIVAKGTPLELKNTYAHDSLQLAFNVNKKAELATLLENHKIEYQMKEEVIVINVENTIHALPLLELTKDYINGFEVLNGTMDDVFLNIIGYQV